MAISKDRCCGIGMLTIACISGAIFIYAAVKFAEYTPLYMPISCLIIDQARSFASDTVESITTRSCHNPNSYSLELDNREPGKSYVLLENNTLVPLGGYHFNYAKLGAKSTHNVTTVMSAPISEAVKYGTWKMIRFISQVKIKTRGDVTLFGVRVGSWMPKDEFCGVEVRLEAPKTYGPIVCGSNWEELVIPSWNATPAAMELHMDPHTLQQKAEQKNAALGTILGASGVMILWSLTVAIRHLCCRRTSGSLKMKGRGVGETSKLSSVPESTSADARIENEQV